MSIKVREELIEENFDANFKSLLAIWRDVVVAVKELAMLPENGPLVEVSRGLLIKLKHQMKSLDYWIN